MKNVEVFRALSSDSRWDILNSLSYEPKDINELANEVGLKPVTVRHHIHTLTQAGLVEQFKEKKGTVGRPNTLYRIPGNNIRVSFPHRNYFLFNQIIIEGQHSLLGEEAAKDILFKIAEKTGNAYVKDLASRNKVEEWSIDLFRHLFVEGLMREMGTEPEVVSQSGREIIFQERNCLFYEIAKKNPELVCNGLDSGFHEGIVKALGPYFVGTRLNCMGHGDPYCRYKIRWNRPFKAPPS